MDGTAAMILTNDVLDFYDKISKNENEKGPEIEINAGKFLLDTITIADPTNELLQSDQYNKLFEETNTRRKNHICVYPYEYGDTNSQFAILTW